MKRLGLLTTLALLFTLSYMSCKQKDAESLYSPKGKLFIVGGGSKTVQMIDRLIAESGVDKKGYIAILSMASEEEDTAILYSSKQFTDRGINSIYSIRTDSVNGYSDSIVNLIQNASLIYICGGDQSRFMKAIKGSRIQEVMHKAYNEGATISGTSAGAAVMSKKMITGNELKHPIYTGNYPTIEANNIEISTGLGFLSDVIIDQHFVKRQRLNRLIAVSLENPEYTCIGIDESTAILVKGTKVEVVGESQVIIIKHLKTETKVVNGLLGGKDLSLSVYLPGDFFDL